MTAWQHIETAPEWQMVLIAYYNPGSAIPLWVAAEKKRAGGRWGTPSHSYTPTHWLPLPAPPALAAATGTAKTAQRVECEASQSGPQGNAQTPPGSDQ